MIRNIRQNRLREEDEEYESEEAMSGSFVQLGDRPQFASSAAAEDPFWFWDYTSPAEEVKERNKRSIAAYTNFLARMSKEAADLKPQTDIESPAQSSEVLDNIIDSMLELQF